MPSFDKFTNLGIKQIYTPFIVGTNQNLEFMNWWISEIMSIFLVIYSTVQLLCLEACFLSGNIIIDCLVWLLSRTHTHLSIWKNSSRSIIINYQAVLCLIIKKLDTKTYDFQQNERSENILTKKIKGTWIHKIFDSSLQK